MVPVPQFGNVSVNLSYTGKLLYLVAIAPNESAPRYSIYDGVRQ